MWRRKSFVDHVKSRHDTERNIMNWGRTLFFGHQKKSTGTFFHTWVQNSQSTFCHSLIAHSCKLALAQQSVIDDQPLTSTVQRTYNRYCTHQSFLHSSASVLPLPLLSGLSPISLNAKLLSSSSLMAVRIRWSHWLDTTGWDRLSPQIELHLLITVRSPGEGAAVQQFFSAGHWWWEVVRNAHPGFHGCFHGLFFPPLFLPLWPYYCFVQFRQISGDIRI